jgi:hypothetical protein
MMATLLPKKGSQNNGWSKNGLEVSNPIDSHHIANLATILNDVLPQNKIDHESQSKMCWSGGGCNFKKNFGMKAVTKGIE